MRCDLSACADFRAVEAAVRDGVERALCAERDFAAARELPSQRIGLEVLLPAVEAPLALAAQGEGDLRKLREAKVVKATVAPDERVPERLSGFIVSSREALLRGAGQ